MNSRLSRKRKKTYKVEIKQMKDFCRFNHKTCQIVKFIPNKEKGNIYKCLCCCSKH